MQDIKESVLHQIAARYISGKIVEIEIKGSKLQLECFTRLLNVSKDLKICLDENKNIDTISSLLEEKKKLTKEFQNLTGIKWRL